MKRIAERVCLWCILVMVLAAAVPPEKGLVLIVNKANPVRSLTRKKVGYLYMGEISRWPFGAEAVAVDLPDKSPLRLLFLKTILKTTADEWKAYWIDKKMTGNVDPPRKAADASEAKRIVASKPGAIAYISSDAVDDTVKVLVIE